MTIMNKVYVFLFIAFVASQILARMPGKKPEPGRAEFEALAARLMKTAQANQKTTPYNGPCIIAGGVNNTLDASQYCICTNYGCSTGCDQHPFRLNVSPAEKTKHELKNEVREGNK